jgi:hypothetical protein
MRHGNKQHEIEKEIDKLSPATKTEFKRLKKRQMLKLARITTKIFDNSCGVCKAKMMTDVGKVKNIDDVCADCQTNPDVLRAFKKLETLYKRVSE